MPAPSPRSALSKYIYLRVLVGSDTGTFPPSPPSLFTNRMPKHFASRPVPRPAYYSRIELSSSTPTPSSPHSICLFRKSSAEAQFLDTDGLLSLPLIDLSGYRHRFSGLEATPIPHDPPFAVFITPQLGEEHHLNPS